MQGMQEFKYYVRHSVLSGLFERPCVTAHEAPETIQVATDTLIISAQRMPLILLIS